MFIINSEGSRQEARGIYHWPLFLLYIPHFSPRITPLSVLIPYIPILLAWPALRAQVFG